VNRKVSREEMVARVSQIYAGKARLKKCLKANSLKRPAVPVSPGLIKSFFSVCWFTSFDSFGLCLLQDRKQQFWCPAPLREGEQHRRKLRPDKYQPPAARLLENYESDSSVEADEDTNPEIGGDAGTSPEASSTLNPRRKTRVAAAKQLISTATAKVAAVKTAKLEVEKKKKRKRKTSPPPAVETPVIPIPPTREVESEEEEDEATDVPLVVEDWTVGRSRLRRR
jgi:hypothetical protein